MGAAPGPPPSRDQGTTSAEGGDVVLAGSRFRLLYVAALLSYGDRYLIPPLLVSMARDLGVSLAAVTVVATLYFFLYGGMQPVYGMLSDRWGRVRVIRGAVVGMAAANVVAAAAPSLGFVVAGKAVSAAFAAGILPTTLAYVGDSVRFARRQQVIANVLAAGAIGTVAAIAAGGLVGRFASWRLAFGAYAALALALAARLHRLPESPRSERRAGPWAQARLVLRRRWAVFLIVLAVAEGAVMLGFLTFLAPALEASGESSAVAGVVVATYGVGVFGGLQLVKRLVARTSMPASWVIATGGVLLVPAYLLAALDQGVDNILAASILIGSAYAFLHSTLQTWATETVPEARGTAISLFVAAVYIGAAIGTSGVSGLADAGRYRSLFLIAAGLTVPLVVVASMARARFTSADPP